MNTDTDTDSEVRPVTRVLADLNLDPILQSGFLSSYFWILFHNPDSYIFTSVSDSTARILVFLHLDPILQPVFLSSYFCIRFYNPDSCLLGIRFYNLDSCLRFAVF
jgi:hypothetical protein